MKLQITNTHNYRIRRKFPSMSNTHVHLMHSASALPSSNTAGIYGYPTTIKMKKRTPSKRLLFKIWCMYMGQGGE
jgi:hypothetical protein